MRRRMNIGTTSLILIFVVLCLAVFGLFSLSSAQGDWNLARKNAEAVQGYYEADAAGEAFVRKADRILQEAEAQGLSGAAREAYLQAQLGEFFQDGLAVTDIGMEYGQALHIELDLAGDEIQIKSWNVYNREEYEIDSSVPVWTGEE